MNCSYTPLLFGDNLLCKWSIFIKFVSIVTLMFLSNTKRMEYVVCSQLFKKCLRSSFNKRSNTLIFK